MNLNFIFKITSIIDKFNVFENSYNIYNTLLFSVIGIIFYFFIVWNYLLWRKVKVDFEFIKSVFIFIVIGSILRLFSQTYTSVGGIINLSNNPLSLGFYFQFPWMFILLALSFLICFEVSLYLSKSFNCSYNRILQIIGLIILIPLLFLIIININYWLFFLGIIFSSLILLCLFVFIFKFIKNKLLNSKINKLVLLSQILDGVSTFVAIVFFKNIFSEQHVVSSFVLSINPILFILIKIILSLLVVYLIDRFIKNKFERNYYKLFVIIIGFITGLRDLFTIALLIF